MIRNVGEKIKVVAIVLFVIGAIYMIILGINTAHETPILGTCIALIGPCAVAVNSLLMYGFGELIENTRDIAGNTYKAKSNVDYEKIDKISVDD